MGRILKKDSKKKLGSIEISEYPWVNFREKDLVFTDNSRRSVILSKYHDPKEIELKIKVPSNFHEQLDKKIFPIMPIDLTEDFDLSQKELIRKNRRRLLDEETAVVLELAELDGNKITQKKDRRWVQNQEEIEKKISKEKLDITSQEPKVISVQIKSNEEQIHTDKVTNVEGKNISSQQAELKKEDLSSLKQKMFEDTASFSDGFSQGFQKGFSEGRESGLKIGAIEGKEKGYNDGFQSGQEEGFKIGENKGQQDAETRYDKSFENIHEVINKIESLKSQILNESKDVFIEIVKLCSEKLLREELRLNDTHLFKLFDEIVNNYSDNQFLNVQLNNEDLKRLKKHVENSTDKNRIRLKENNELSNGDFKIETENGISIVNLKKSVDDIIHALHDDLFSANEINNIHDKAS